MSLPSSKHVKYVF